MRKRHPRRSGQAPFLLLFMKTTVRIPDTPITSMSLPRSCPPTAPAATISPSSVETPKTLKIRSGCEGGRKDVLIQDNKSATLGLNNDQMLFVPTVYDICSKDSNAMKSSNPHSGIYEADTSRTLDSNGGNPSCNQDGIAVVALEGNGARASHKSCGYFE